MRGRASRQRQRGAIFGMVLITALAMSISAYGALFVAVTNARHSRLSRERVRARYLAEAASVYARDRLWTNPTDCGGPMSLITDGVTGAVAWVNVVVTECGPGNENRPHRITATVNY